MTLLCDAPERTEYQLLDQVRVAGEAYFAAAAEYARISSEFGHRAGALALWRAATNEDIAFERYSEALEALAQVIRQGRSPFHQTTMIGSVDR
jgi:hypothetical protein